MEKGVNSCRTDPKEVGAVPEGLTSWTKGSVPEGLTPWKLEQFLKDRSHGKGSVPEGQIPWKEIHTRAVPGGLTSCKKGISSCRTDPMEKGHTLEQFLMELPLSHWKKIKRILSPGRREG